MQQTEQSTAPSIARPARMTAMRVHAFGGPDAIVEDKIDIPQPGTGELLVRVHAAGVGPWDAWIRSGQSVLPQPLPLTLGSDVSGVVAALGSDVTEFTRGEEVYGVTNQRFTDGYAQYALCRATMMATKPERLTHIEAASAPVVAVTALQMLFDHAGLKPGQRVVVQGAAGNVGAYAVQLAHRANLHVVAIAAMQDTAMLMELGASEVVDRDCLRPVPVDAVIDLVGGDGQDQLFDFLAPGGALISAVKKPDAMLAMDRSVRANFILVDVRSTDLSKLAVLFDQRLLRTNVGEVLPLSQAQQAHEMMAGTIVHRQGKIVLQV